MSFSANDLPLCDRVHVGLARKNQKFPSSIFLYGDGGQVVEFSFCEKNQLLTTPNPGDFQKRESGYSSFLPVVLFQIGEFQKVEAAQYVIQLTVSHCLPLTAAVYPTESIHEQAGVSG